MPADSESGYAGSGDVEGSQRGVEDQADPSLSVTMEEFVTAERLALTRLALLLTGSRDVAEDLVQTVLVRLLARDNWDGITHPRAYVRRAVVNEWQNESRRTRQVRGAVRAMAAMDFQPDMASQTVEHAWVWAALNVLPSNQRVAVILRYYLDLDDGDSAAILECSRSTIRSHIRRALPKVAQQLAATSKGG